VSRPISGSTYISRCSLVLGAGRGPERPLPRGALGFQRLPARRGDGLQKMIRLFCIGIRDLPLQIFLSSSLSHRGCPTRLTKNDATLWSGRSASPSPTRSRGPRGKRRYLRVHLHAEDQGDVDATPAAIDSRMAECLGIGGDLDEGSADRRFPEALASSTWAAVSRADNGETSSETKSVRALEPVEGGPQHVAGLRTSSMASVS